MKMRPKQQERSRLQDRLLSDFWGVSACISADSETNHTIFIKWLPPHYYSLHLGSDFQLSHGTNPGLFGFPSFRPVISLEITHHQLNQSYAKRKPITTKSIPISCACFYAEFLFAPWVVPFQQLGLLSFMLSLKTLKKRSDKVTVHAIPLSSHASFAALTRASAWGLLNSNLPNSSSISSKESRLIRSRSLGSRPTAAGPRSRHWSPIHSATSLSQSKRNNIHLYDISQLGHEIWIVNATGL